LNAIRDTQEILLDGINKNVMTTKEDIGKMAERLLSYPTGLPTAAGLLVPPSLDKSKFGRVRYWEQGQWQAIRNRMKDGNIGLDSPIISLYMEDEAGGPISPGSKTALRGDLISYWNDISRSGEELTNFTELGLERKDHFRNTFEAKYPWLRLCEAHWKVDHLWINYFGSWKKSRASPEPNARQPTVGTKPSESATTDTSSITEVSGVSTGSKCGCEEVDHPDNNSKRLKGKDKQIFTPTKFHSSRPIPRKRLAKLAKVCELSPAVT
jgi:hypothetical protein